MNCIFGKAGKPYLASSMPIVLHTQPIHIRHSFLPLKSRNEKQKLARLKNSSVPEINVPIIFAPLHHTERMQQVKIPLLMCGRAAIIGNT